MNSVMGSYAITLLQHLDFDNSHLQPFRPRNSCRGTWTPLLSQELCDVFSCNIMYDFLLINAI